MGVAANLLEVARGDGLAPSSSPLGTIERSEKPGKLPRIRCRAMCTRGKRFIEESQCCLMMRSTIVVREAGSRKQSAAVLKATIERWRVASCAAHFDQRSP